MPNLAIIADLHLDEYPNAGINDQGVNRRLADGLRAFDEAVRLAVTNKCTDLIVAGDFFHRRRAVTVPTLSLAAKALREAGESLMVHLLEGNHDLDPTGRHCSLSGLPNTVIRSAKVLTVAGQEVLFAPWRAWSKPKAIGQMVKSEKVDIVVGHAAVNGARVGPIDFEMEDANVESADLGKLGVPVVLGHYHKPQEVVPGAVWYAGSPLQLTWGERGDAKRMLVFSNGKMKSIPLTSAPVFIDALAVEDAQKARPQDYVRLTASSAKEAAGLRKRVQEEGLTNCAVTISKPRSLTNCTFDSTVVSQSVEHQIEAWVKHRPPEFSRKRALRTARRIMEKTND